MAIDNSGWFDFAIRDPGYPQGVNGGRNGGKGVVPHSAEGDFDSLEDLHDFHWARATAPPGKKASWGATNLKDGRFVQHYSVWAQTWTSGSGYPNNNFFAFENEGRAGEPLTQAQTDNVIRVIRELSALQGWTPERPLSEVDNDASLYEHGECVRFGSAATACPSGRIPWKEILAALEPEGDEDMKPFFAWDYQRARAYLIGPFGACYVVDPKDATELEKLYGKPVIALSSATIDGFNQ